MIVYLHHGRGVIASLIRWQSRGPYSHVSMQMPDGSIMESREFKGVRRLPKLEPLRPGEYIDVYEIEATPAQVGCIVRFLEAQLGKGYDYLSILLFITRKPVQHWNKTKWFCSEIAFEAFHTAGFVLLQNVLAWAVSPNLFSLSPLLHYRGRFLPQPK
jgi:uncharacterized protein YycO